MLSSAEHTDTKWTGVNVVMNSGSIRRISFSIWATLLGNLPPLAKVVLVHRLDLSLSYLFGTEYGKLNVLLYPKSSCSLPNRWFSLQLCFEEGKEVLEKLLKQYVSMLVSRHKIISSLLHGLRRVCYSRIYLDEFASCMSFLPLFGVWQCGVSRA